jgi:hypothetical protein
MSGAPARRRKTRQQAPPLNPDYYVVPKKLYPYDLKSAKQLTQQPVWVREGYRFTYYPYNRTRHRTDFAHEAGLLLPIQKLEIKDVVTDTAPHSAHLHQVMAVFRTGWQELRRPYWFADRRQLSDLFRRNVLHPGSA